ncbi:UDP-glucuronosyltransferase 2B13 isoform X2 [Drosophila navojoa]|uniref:UDP-glucuronosyltransferase 2B13 isoform X2 n=1 Tax=Drosophila navojoa TaxID=7232 RepID=UPI0011BD7A54|nr:UDP-glucuronosyltransferase 2B13 isoform X2 [Drosophila navojoa]
MCMQLQSRSLLCFVVLAICGLYSDAYRILFMGPFPAPSHWMWLEHFQRDLLKRGHHVTSLNNHPTKTPHENLTEIILNPIFDIPKHFPKENLFTMRYASDFQNLQMYWKIGQLTTEHALQDPQVKRLIESQDEHYDLVILEQYFHEAFLMFGHKFKCPVVTIGTMGYADNMDHAMGILTPWSFIPHLLLSHTDKMSFSQRAYNSYLSLYDVVVRRWYYMPRMQRIAEKYFGSVTKGDFPNVLDLERNISLMLINSHRSVDLPRPSMPGLINVGGAHIQPVQKLPEDIQRFMDNATHGVVYFSLGSYMKSTDMPPEKTAQFLQAFGRLKQQVLWKYENASIGQLPANVMIRKWMPQNDILAHPNLKLFITHGGIFGTQEGIYWGVPMLCIPLFGDQHRNTIKSVREGYARSMNFAQLNVEDLVSNIEALIYEPAYKRSALEISKRFRDNPIHPLEEASYWIEYIIRHRGALFLKSQGAQMPLYQYLLLDVIGCALLLLWLAVWLPWRMLRKVYNWWALSAATAQKRETKKRL